MPPLHDAETLSLIDRAPGTHNRQNTQNAQLTQITQLTKIGRYDILQTIGSGGMGMVFLAHDPQLDRHVAIKLLRPRKQRRNAENATKRLVREAQALAQLSHPNVVHVYDAGAIEGGAFIAMEFVPGRSLNDYCKTVPRPSWRDVLAKYLDAGRGLAAAHEAGLVHRDFKPENILLGDDGRVRVADFGLAAAMERSEGSRTDEDSEDLGVQSSPGFSSGLKEPLTRTGALLGTPPYMAPEQHRRDAVGPATDQYCFCVSLYEGLYGQRPFRIDDKSRALTELLTRKLRMDIAPPPPGTEVPMWLRKVILRGLAPAPKDRWPSMDALLFALKDDPSVRRRRALTWLGALAGIASLASVAALGWLRPPKDESPCKPAAPELAGIWDEAVKGSMVARFAATELAYAKDTAARVSHLLDAYAAAWTAMRTEACEATYHSGQQSEQILLWRMDCLDRRKSRLQVLTATWKESADPAMVESSIEAALALPRIAECAGMPALGAQGIPPIPLKDAERRAKAMELRARLDQTYVLEAAGRFQQGLGIAEEVAAQSDSVAYPPLKAEALFRLAVLRWQSGDAEGAANLLADALPAAAKAKDDVLIARAWSELLWVKGYVQARYQDALRMEEAARTQAERADSDAARALLCSRLGSVHYAMESYEQAKGYQERALALRERIQGEREGESDIAVLAALEDLALTLRALGEYERALGLYERALAMRQERFGVEHPRVAMILGHMGATLGEMGKLEEAQRYGERALTTLEGAAGVGSMHVAELSEELGQAMARRGQYGEALRHYQRAVAIRTRHLGPEHPLVALATARAGDAYAGQGMEAEARHAYERALAIYRSAKSTRWVREAAAMHSALCRLHRERDAVVARAHCEQAVAMYEAALGEGHPKVLRALLTLGELLMAQDAAPAAAAAYERAVKTADGLGSPDRADAYVGLAKSLREQAGAGARVAELAAKAAELYAERGDTSARDAALRLVSEAR